MLKGHLPRVIYITEYTNIRRFDPRGEASRAEHGREFRLVEHRGHNLLLQEACECRGLRVYARLTRGFKVNARITLALNGLAEHRDHDALLKEAREWLGLKRVPRS